MRYVRINERQILSLMMNNVRAAGLTVSLTRISFVICTNALLICYCDHGHKQL